MTLISLIVTLSGAYYNSTNNYYVIYKGEHKHVIDCTRFGPFQLCCRGIKSICPPAGGVSLFTAIAHYLLKRIWKDARGADPNISQTSLTRNVELSWDGYCNSTCRYKEMFTTTIHAPKEHLDDHYGIHCTIMVHTAKQSSSLTNWWDAVSLNIRLKESKLLQYIAIT